MADDQKARRLRGRRIRCRRYRPVRAQQAQHGGNRRRCAIERVDEQPASRAREIEGGMAGRCNCPARSKKKAKEKKTRIENQHHTEPAQIVIAEGSNKRQLDLCSHDTTEPQFKKRKTTGSKHHTTKDETDILSSLKVYKDKLPDDAISSIREHLSDVWTIKKVREWWYYHKDK